MSIIKTWFVLKVATQSELKAEKQIRRMGYDAIAPYAEGLRRVRKNNRPWKWPLFPGYLFASWTNWNEGWNRVTGKLDPSETITSIYGFLGPVWAPMPSLLNPADVDYLLSISDGKYKPDHQEPPRLKIGDHVLIPDGPFEGRTGMLSEMRGKKGTVSVRGEKNVLDVEIALVKLEKCE